MGDDRRKHKRAPLLLDMVWEGGAGKYEARTGDIGVGGCFIDSIGQVTVGENINFKLCLPGGRVYSFSETNTDRRQRQCRSCGVTATCGGDVFRTTHSQQ